MAATHSIQPTKANIVYKTVDGLDIPLDLFLPDGAQNAPVLIWFHGGGLLQGTRENLAPFMRRAVNTHGIAIASADYRLAPQASVQDILDDVQACVAFVRTQLASHAGAGALDPSRLAVSGSSAGGFLALLAGLYVDPKPRCVLPIYPITDPLGTFFTRRQPIPPERKLASREELAEFLDVAAQPVANNAPDSPRMNMYVRMMHDANLAALWRVPEGEAADKWRLSRQIYSRRCSPAYVIHGDADRYVGVEQADEVVGALLGVGIEVEYERPHGLDHMLDMGTDYENERFFSFLLKHV